MKWTAGFILGEMVSWVNSPRNAVTWISLDLTVMFFHTNNGLDKNVNKKNYRNAKGHACVLSCLGTRILCLLDGHRVLVLATAVCFSVLWVPIISATV